MIDFQSPLKARTARAPHLELWTAALIRVANADSYVVQKPCRRFQSADMSAHSKSGLSLLSSFPSVQKSVFIRLSTEALAKADVHPCLNSFQGFPSLRKAMQAPPPERGECR
jgi:hypothetical protein